MEDVIRRTAVLASFCPDEIIRFFSEDDLNGGVEDEHLGNGDKGENKRRKRLRLTEPLIMEPHECVVLWIDICKFTSLAEKLQPEKLGEAISNFFSAVIEQIVAHGGDVLKFCGDALLCSFRDAAEKFEDIQTGINASVLSACQCALDIQSSDFIIHDITFQLRASVALGTTHCMLVGGTRDRWEYMVTGEPLHDIRVMDKVCLPGQVIISGQVAQRLKSMSDQFDCIVTKVSESDGSGQDQKSWSIGSSFGRCSTGSTSSVARKKRLSEPPDVRKRHARLSWSSNCDTLDEEGESIDKIGELGIENITTRENKKNKKKIEAMGQNNGPESWKLKIEKEKEKEEGEEEEEEETKETINKSSPVSNLKKVVSPMKMVRSPMKMGRSPMKMGRSPKLTRNVDTSDPKEPLQMALSPRTKITRQISTESQKSSKNASPKYASVGTLPLFCRENHSENAQVPLTLSVAIPPPAPANILTVDVKNVDISRGVLDTTDGLRSKEAERTAFRNRSQVANRRQRVRRFNTDSNLPRWTPVQNEHDPLARKPSLMSVPRSRASTEDLEKRVECHLLLNISPIVDQASLIVLGPSVADLSSFATEDEMDSRTEKDKTDSESPITVRAKKQFRVQHPLEYLVPYQIRNQLNFLQAQFEENATAIDYNQEFWNNERFAKVQNVTVLFIKIHNITEDSFLDEIDKEEEKAGEESETDADSAYSSVASYRDNERFAPLTPRSSSPCHTSRCKRQGKLLADAIHQSITIIETNLYRYGGTLRQMLCDDKGTVAIGVFSSSPTQFRNSGCSNLSSDDVAFAVLCALEIQSGLASHDYEFLSSVGIATGEAFCGIIGSNQRSEYVIVGDTVNTAARIMDKADPACPERAVACDETTRQKCKKSWMIRFSDQVDQVQVKNKKKALDLHYPHIPKNQEDHATRQQNLFLGRTVAKSIISDLLEPKDATQGINRVVLFQGEKGSGKTALWNFISTSRSQVQAPPYYEFKDFDRDSEYSFARQFYKQLLQVETPGWVQRLVKILQKRNKRALAYIDVLSTLFPQASGHLAGARSALGFPQPWIPSSSERDTLLNCLLVSIFQIHHTFEPVILSIDNVDQMDPKSWCWFMLLVVTCADRNLEELPSSEESIDSQFRRRSTFESSPLNPDGDSPSAFASASNSFNNDNVRGDDGEGGASPVRNLPLTPTNSKAKPISRRRRSCMASLERSQPDFSIFKPEVNTLGQEPKIIIPPLNLAIDNGDEQGCDLHQNKDQSNDSEMDFQTKANDTSTLEQGMKEASPPFGFEEDGHDLDDQEAEMENKKQGGGSALERLRLELLETPQKPATTKSSAQPKRPCQTNPLKMDKGFRWILTRSPKTNKDIRCFSNLFGIFEAAPRTLLSVVMTCTVATCDRVMVERLDQLKRLREIGKISLRNVPIRELDQEDSVKLIRHFVSTHLPASLFDSKVPIEICHDIFSLSQGNPLLMEQLIEKAMKDGVIYFENGQLVHDQATLFHIYLQDETIA